MERKDFLGMLFSAAALASLPKCITDLAKDSVPGINGSVFKLKIHRGWFSKYDLIRIGGDKEFFVLDINEEIGKMRLAKYDIEYDMNGVRRKGYPDINTVIDVDVEFLEPGLKKANVGLFGFCIRDTAEECERVNNAYSLSNGSIS